MLTAGLLSITFRQLPAERIVALTAGAKLAGIEWGGDIHVPHGDLATAAAVKRMCDDHGLAVAAYGSYYRAGGHGSNPDWSAVVDTAAALGTTTIRVWPGTKGSADTTPAGRSAVVDDLARCCDAAPAVTVATEFHGGTLTDEITSTVDLLTTVARPNLKTFWQPPNGMAPAESLAGLRRVKPWLSNVHVFHWWPDGNTRHPLAEGADRWPDYLREADDGSPRFASLEFVRGDDVEQFVRDAATLLAWLGGTSGVTPGFDVGEAGV